MRASACKEFFVRSAPLPLAPGPGDDLIQPQRPFGSQARVDRMKCLTRVALMAVLAVGLGASSSSSGGAWATAIQSAAVRTVVGAASAVGGGSQGGDGRCLTASNGHRWCDETDQGGFDLASAYKISKQVCKTFGMKASQRNITPHRSGVGSTGVLKGLSSGSASSGIRGLSRRVWMTPFISCYVTSPSRRWWKWPWTVRTKRQRRPLAKSATTHARTRRRRGGASLIDVKRSFGRPSLAGRCPHSSEALADSSWQRRDERVHEPA